LGRITKRKKGLAETEVTSPEKETLEKTAAERPAKKPEKAAHEKYFKKIISEMTPRIFERAIKDEDVWLAHSQLENAFTHKMKEYQDMKNNFLEFIDNILESTELSEKYRDFLRITKSQVETDAYRAEPKIEKTVTEEEEKLPKEKREELRKKMEEIEIEAVPQLFDSALANDDLFFAYRHLKKAFGAKLPEYGEMKERYILACDIQIAFPDEKLKKVAQEKLQSLRDKIEADTFE